MESIKVRLWVLMRDQTLTHLSADISLIPKHILDHNISLKNWDPGLSIGSSFFLYYTIRENSNRAKKSKVEIFHLYFFKWDISFLIPHISWPNFLWLI